MSTPILLLKTRSSPHDAYADFFKDYQPSFIPVLEHRFNTENLLQVRTLFATGAFDLDQEPSNGTTDKKYGGMIFTSQRAVEGFADIISQHGLPTTSSPILYTVGPATARSLTTLRDAHLPNSQIHGAEAGNGENLAKLILAHYNSLHTGTYGKNKPGLLFLVGEQRRDIIPRTLMGASPEDRIDVEEMVVYETGEMDSFERDFGVCVSKYKEEEVWVVVFSPTGCEGMLRVLGLGPFKDGNEAGNEAGNKKGRVFVATIGPTTRDYLRNRFGFEPDVCAERPSPEGIEEGIKRFRESRV